MTPLTPREHQIGKLVARGLINRDIAEQVNLAIGSVKNHLKLMFDKAGCDNRTQFALWYARNFPDVPRNPSDPQST